jgi:hypothetical protein
MHCLKTFRRKMLEWMSHRVHLAYLSAYSPELNLIEIRMWQMKHAWLPLSTFSRLAASAMRFTVFYMATENRAFRVYVDLRRSQLAGSYRSMGPASSCGDV